MSRLVIPGRERDFEGADWPTVVGVMPSAAFAGTRTRPVLVRARDDKGEDATWVLKLRSRLTPTSSALELIGYRFADALKIPTPAFGVIEIREPLARSVSAGNQADFVASVGPNFATQYLDGYIDLADPSSIRRAQRPTAVHMFGWDALVDNADRRLGNPNVLLGDGGILAIDHEHTFSWSRAVPEEAPQWVPRFVHRLLREHLFSGHVADWVDRYDADLAPLRALATVDVSQMFAGLPSAWLTPECTECVAKVTVYMEDLVDRCNDVLVRIEEAITHG
jgi:hypothetical protein